MALRIAAAIVIAIAVFSAADRARLLVGRGGGVTEFQRSIIRGMHGDGPGATRAMQDLALLEERYATHRAPMLLHIVAGALFLIAAPLQFSARLRAARPALHRWTGRVLMPAALLTALTGLYFGVVIPIAGRGEWTSTGVFGALMLFATIRAYMTIRRGDVERHREWMVRAFAIAAGVGTIRIMAGVIQTIAPSMTAIEIVGPAFWSGWLISLGAAELWLRGARPLRERPGTPRVQPVAR